jgi:hypothetical protein
MKTIKAFLFILAAITVLPFSGQSQVNLSDSSTFVPMFSAHYTLQIPGGDMSKQFGVNSSIGGDFKIKTPSNWIFVSFFSYMFGDAVKNKDSIFSRITTSNGELIDGNGTFAYWQVYERGFFTDISFGKLFPVFGSNPNSGLVIMGGAGYIQHKYKIEVRDESLPQLRDDYKKGYDRLRGGFMAKQFLGYLYMGSGKIINFYAGIEFIQAWTKDMREYNFNEMKYTNGNYFDLLYGIKIGWFIPLHKRAPKDFYYY